MPQYPAGLRPSGYRRRVSEPEGLPFTVVFWLSHWWHRRMNGWLPSRSEDVLRCRHGSPVNRSGGTGSFMVVRPAKGHARAIASRSTRGSDNATVALHWAGTACHR